MDSQINKIGASQPPQIMIGDTGIKPVINKQSDAPQVSAIGSDSVKTQNIANGIPATSLNFNPEDKALLLSSASGKLTADFKLNKDVFNEELFILKKLSTGIAFSSLNSNEKAVIGRLGINENNIDQATAKDIVTLVSASTNVNQTQSFRNISKAADNVMGTVATENKRLNTVSSKIKDFEAMQKFTSTLGAGKISSLLEQKGSELYLNTPSQTVGKLVLSDPMDIITRGLLVNSVKSPDNFNKIQEALDKIKDNKSISKKENKLLQEIGLSVQKSGKTITLKDSNGHEINMEKLASIKGFSTVISNPSPELKKVIDASFEVLSQAQIVRTVSDQVSSRTQKVNTSEDELKNVNLKLTNESSKLANLQQTFSIINGLDPKKKLSEIERNLLRRFSIDFNGTSFFKDNKAISSENAKAYINEEIAKTKQSIKILSDRVFTLTNSLSSDVSALDSDIQTLDAEQKELQVKKDNYEKIKAQNLPLMSEDEQHYVNTELDATIQKEVIDTNNYADKVKAEAQDAKEKAIQTLKNSTEQLNQLKKHEHENDDQDDVKPETNQATPKEEYIPPKQQDVEVPETIFEEIKDDRGEQNRKITNAYVNFAITSNMQEKIRAEQKQDRIDHEARREIKQFEMQRQETLEKKEYQLKEDISDDRRNTMYAEQRVQNKIFDKIDFERKLRRGDVTS